MLLGYRKVFMMKLLTITVPSYNSEAYLDRCMATLLPGGDEVEILIVDDGSKDRTAEIADEYERKYPGIVRAIHQETGGHGEAVNAGIRNATGLFFKVVDSDDWVDYEAYMKILKKLRELAGGDTVLDMFIANYVYEKEGVRHKKIMRYSSLPQDKIFTWNEAGRFHKGQYILMHSVIYRTDFLKLCQLRLPKHTFYVDNIYVYYPLPHVRKMYYMDVDFYRYYIGREDQSVNEKVMISRVDQQIFVTKSMIDMYDMRKISNKKLRTYMTNYLAIMMTVSSILLIRSKNAENLEKKRELWQYLKKNHYGTYWKIRYGILGQTMNLPGRSGRKISSLAYIVARRIVGFN